MEHSDWLINNYNTRNNRVPRLTKNLYLVRDGPLMWAGGFQALERGRYTKQALLIFMFIINLEYTCICVFFHKAQKHTLLEIYSKFN